MRRDCEVSVYLDVEQVLAAGMKLYRSANGVVLCSGFNGCIPPSYFRRVVRLRDGAELFRNVRVLLHSCKL